jgi:hypothetical protein
VISALRIAVCTMAHGPHVALLELTAPSLTRYAERHGYEYVEVRHRLDPSRPASWDKVVLLRSLVTKFDVVVWLDADALVLDRAPDIATVLRPRKFLYMVEHRVNGARIPNAGVIVMRGGRAAARFLDQVWKQRRFVADKWWENAAIVHLLGYRDLDGLRPVAPSAWRWGFAALDVAWNSIPADAAPEPYVIHCAGIPFAERMQYLRQFESGER